MRSASVLLLIVLAAGCTAPPPSDEGPESGLVVLEQGAATGFRVGSGGDEGERREERAPPTLPPNSLQPPPGDPPPPSSSESGAAPPPTPAADEGGAFLYPEPERAVRFVLGPDAASGPYVASVALSEDATSFSAALRAVSEATTRIDALVRLENAGSSARDVQLRGPLVDDPRVLAARLLVGAASADLRAPDANLSLRLEPGGRVDVGFETTLGTTPGGTVLPTWTVRMDVSGS